MKNLIRKILKEEFDNLDWIKDVEVEKRYLGRPKRYRLHPTPMEKLLRALGLAQETEEELTGVYSYGLDRFVTDDELENLDREEVGTNVRGLRLKTILLDNDLIEGKTLVIWLGDLSQKQRLYIGSKLKKMGFNFRGSNRVKSNTYFIKIDPNDYDRISVSNTSWRCGRTKRNAKECYDNAINNRFIVPYDANELLNKI
jgi:hypothetical protein